MLPTWNVIVDQSYNKTFSESGKCYMCLDKTF